MPIKKLNYKKSKLYRRRRKYLAKKGQSFSNPQGLVGPTFWRAPEAAPRTMVLAFDIDNFA